MWDGSGTQALKNPHEVGEGADSPPFTRWSSRESGPWTFPRQVTERYGELIREREHGVWVDERCYLPTHPRPPLTPYYLW